VSQEVSQGEPRGELVKLLSPQGVSQVSQANSSPYVMEESAPFVPRVLDLVRDALKPAHLPPDHPDAEGVVRSYLTGQGVTVAQIRSALARLSNE
jgi:hypothetical protein